MGKGPHWFQERDMEWQSVWEKKDKGMNENRRMEKRDG